MSMYKLTIEGKEYLEKGLPEKQLLRFAKSGKGLKEIQKSKIATIGLNWAKKNKWILIENGKIKLTNIGEKALEERTGAEQALEEIEKTGKTNPELVKILLGRKLIEERKENILKKAEKQLGREILHLTPELIKTGLFEKAKFKPYNVKAVGKKIYPGRVHPLTQIALKVKNVLIEMGFQEMRGPFVESSFYNFDLLFMPQDHPGREIMDTFFMKNPKKTLKLPNKLVKIVKQVHENGWKTGSKGWQYEWKGETARKNILRTHTTADTFRYLAEGVKIPCKYFSVDRVFRNETIDFKHLPEFFQIEGFVADPNLNLRNMMGIFKEFYLRFGVDKLRFKPTYNPYTEPSMEIFGWHKGMKKFIEIGNSGMFRPETLLPCDVKVPVIAWGLALERLAMLVYDIKDIRQILGPTVDIDFIRSYPNIVKW